MNPSRSQVVRYAVTELYYRESMRDYGELPGSPFTKQKSATLQGYAEHAYHATLGKD
jgi:hypothetical protein